MLEIFSGENLINLVRTASYLGLFLIVFAETGLFFGFFFPGDSLLFATGLIASQGALNLPLSIIIIFVAAVLGNMVGYMFGKKVGPKIFTKENSLFFDKNNILRAQSFYEKHGAKTIIITRFIPIIRTFAPIVAGIGNMEYKKFLMYNIIGGLIWSFGIIIAGYYLGTTVKNIDKYIAPIIILIIVVSFIPAIIEIFKKHD